MQCAQIHASQTPIMAKVRTILSPETVMKLSSMELRARAIVEGHLSGQHRSPYRGASVEFADHREYTPGDETRHIDWKVYGRRDRLFVKEFESETNLNVHLLVDVSRSMDYGAPVTKLQYATHLAAALAYLATRQRDATSLCLFDAEVREFLEPQTTATHLRRIFDALDAAHAGEDTDIATVLGSVAQSVKRRGLVVLISDLLDEAEPVLRALGYFRHRGHDVAVLQVMDPTELHFSFRGVTQFEDLETGARLTAEPSQARAEYLHALGQFIATIRDGCRERHIDHQLLDTGEPFDAALAAYLGRRARAR